MELVSKICRDIENWNSELCSLTKYPHPFQTTAFAKHCELKGYKSIYINVYCSGNLISKCYVFEKSKIATWLYGPTILAGWENKQNDILKEIKNILKNYGIVHLDNCATQTFYEYSDFAQIVDCTNAEYEMPYILLKNEVNLITKNFNDSLKKGIRKCEKNNIEVIFTSNKSDILKYEEILKYHRDTLNFDMPFMYPSLANIDIFRNQRITCEVGLAFYGDKLLAGLGFLEFNKLLIEVGSAQGPLYNKLKLPAFEFIKIKAIEKYKENGCEIYDLMGVKKNPLTIKEKNIKNFKSKFTKSKGHSSYISGETFRPIEYFFRRIKRKLNL